MYPFAEKPTCNLWFNQVDKWNKQLDQTVFIPRHREEVRPIRCEIDPISKLATYLIIIKHMGGIKMKNMIIVRDIVRSITVID